MALPADPADVEDFDATVEALDRGRRARLIRTTRTALGLSQTEFAGHFRVTVGTLRDWEWARVSPPDFAVAYVKVLGKFPDMVAGGEVSGRSQLRPAAAVGRPRSAR
ncbi:MAG: helix-turn-helix domain-containing protein [Rhizobiaceae bacterium]|nr:helix-turn-helix domain-containing protein [Rhizobiaceae bacterium]